MVKVKVIHEQKGFTHNIQTRLCHYNCSEKTHLLNKTNKPNLGLNHTFLSHIILPDCKIFLGTDSHQVSFHTLGCRLKLLKLFLLATHTRFWSQTPHCTWATWQDWCIWHITGFNIRLNTVVLNHFVVARLLGVAEPPSPSLFKYRIIIS